MASPECLEPQMNADERRYSQILHEYLNLIQDIILETAFEPPINTEIQKLLFAS